MDVEVAGVQFITSFRLLCNNHPERNLLVPVNDLLNYTIFSVLLVLLSRRAEVLVMAGVSSTTPPSEVKSNADESNPDSTNGKVG